MNSNDIKVINRYNLPFVVSAISKESPDVVSASTIDEIYKKLLKYVNVSKEIKDQHIRDIENADKLSKSPVVTPISSSDASSNICPRCGGKLVLRNAKKGKYAGQSFLGCSNYPRCRYIQPASNK